MKVYIKNKFLSLGGSSSVVDENKKPVFKVKGKILSITRKKFIKDLNNKTLFKVRNKFFNWFKHTAYIYDANNTLVAKVYDKFMNVNREYFIDGLQDEIKIDGGFFSLTSNILRNGEVVGTIRRKVDLFVDSFELDGDEQDMPFLVALVIAIDNIVDKKSKTN